MKKLFLDDRRSAPDNTWDVVKSYKQFTRYIKENGLPEIISFDHDLGAKHDGKDCANWLVEYCLDNKEKMPKYIVHSANPPGRDNIRLYLNNYVKWIENDK